MAAHSGLQFLECVSKYIKPRSHDVLREECLASCVRSVPGTECCVCVNYQMTTENIVYKCVVVNIIGKHCLQMCSGQHYW